MPTKAWREANPDKVRASRRRWYNKNTEHAKSHVNKRRREIRAWFQIYKIEQHLKCNQCGEDHVAALDFHHRDRKTKEGNITSLIDQRGFSKERILAELAKCDVLCANCHRKLHWKETDSKSSSLNPNENTNF